MNVTRPEDKGDKLDKVDELIKRFEKELAKEEDGEAYYHLVVVGEYNRMVCDAVEEQYIYAGWVKVVCKTSSERGEHGGLTRLQLWRNN